MNLLNFWISLDNVKCRDKETTEPRQIPNSGFRLGILTVASETGFPSSTPSWRIRLKRVLIALTKMRTLVPKSR